MTFPSLGVVVVTFNAADVILDCLESLFASQGVQLEIVVVDNASTDSTVTTLHDWAKGRMAYSVPNDLPFVLVPCPKPVPLSITLERHLAHHIALITAGTNSGFAAGVNRGLDLLFADPAIDRVWILNPDSVVPPDTAAAFASHDPGPFALMGGRITYYDQPDMIQIDGGLIGRWTGVTHNSGQYKSALATPLLETTMIDFVSGASVVASRAFYTLAGPMPEDYFLYYEEVDWALRRGDLPLAICPQARVYHRAGTAIGSPKADRPASPFSLYFKHRGRMRFVRRHLPRSRITAWAYTLAKALQYRLKGWRAEAEAVMAGARNVPPPPAIRDRLAPEAAALAFAPDPG